MKLPLEKLSKKHPALFKELAHNYIENGELKKARKALQKYSKLYPDDPSGLLVKGLLEEEMAQYDEAEETYRALIESNPLNIRVLTRLVLLEANKADSSDYWKKMLFNVDPFAPAVKDLLSAYAKSKTKISDESEMTIDTMMETIEKTPPQQGDIKKSKDGVDPKLMDALAKQFDLDEQETEELELIFNDGMVEEPDDDIVLRSSEKTIPIPKSFVKSKEQDSPVEFDEPVETEEAVVETETPTGEQLTEIDIVEDTKDETGKDDFTFSKDFESSLDESDDSEFGDLLYNEDETAPHTGDSEYATPMEELTQDVDPDSPATLLDKSSIDDMLDELGEEELLRKKDKTTISEPKQEMIAEPEIPVEAETLLEEEDFSDLLIDTEADETLISAIQEETERPAESDLTGEDDVDALMADLETSESSEDFLSESEDDSAPVESAATDIIDEIEKPSEAEMTGEGDIDALFDELETGESSEDFLSEFEDDSMPDESKAETETFIEGDQDGIDALVVKMNKGELLDEIEESDKVTTELETDELETEEDFSGDQVGIDALIAKFNGERSVSTEDDIQIEAEEPVQSDTEIDQDFTGSQAGIDDLISQIKESESVKTSQPIQAEAEIPDDSDAESLEISDFGDFETEVDKTEDEEKSDDIDFEFLEPFADAEESQELPKASDSDVEELMNVVKEIAGGAGEAKKETKKPVKGKIYTTTIADLYAKQGKYQEALEIFNSFPPEERLKHSEKIQMLESKIQDMENS